MRTARLPISILQTLPTSNPTDVEISIAENAKIWRPRVYRDGNFGRRLSFDLTSIEGGVVDRMPGTPFTVTYQKRSENQLVVSSFRKGLGKTPKVPFPKFLSLAWAAANAKARELRWIL